jgi:hypothetical protein
MLPNVTEILSTVRLALRSDVIDHSLNPVRLAIARRGYLIQSDILHIPDRFGYFSPGPPRLQAFEGGMFAGMALCQGILFILDAGLVAFYKWWGFPMLVGSPPYFWENKFHFFISMLGCGL